MGRFFVRSATYRVHKTLVGIFPAGIPLVGISDFPSAGIVDLLDSNSEGLAENFLRYNDQ